MRTASPSSDSMSSPRYGSFSDISSRDTRVPPWDTSPSSLSYDSSTTGIYASSLRLMPRSSPRLFA